MLNQKIRIGTCKQNYKKEMYLMKKLLSAKEVAEILGVEISTIYDWVYKKKIEHIKIGKLLRFNPETLQNYINNHTQQGSY